MKFKSIVLASVALSALSALSSASASTDDLDWFMDKPAPKPAPVYVPPRSHWMNNAAVQYKPEQAGVTPITSSGHALPLSMAVLMLVPSDWRVDYGNVDPTALVSWSARDAAWSYAFTDAARQAGMTVDYDTTRNVVTLHDPDEPY